MGGNSSDSCEGITIFVEWEDNFSSQHPIHRHAHRRVANQVQSHNRIQDVSPVFSQTKLWRRLRLHRNSFVVFAGPTAVADPQHIRHQQFERLQDEDSRSVFTRRQDFIVDTSLHPALDFLWLKIQSLCTRDLQQCLAFCWCSEVLR